MIIIETVLADADAIYKKLKETKGYSEACQMVIQSDQVKAIACAVVIAVNKELDVNGLKLGPELASTKPVEDIAGQEMPKSPQMIEPGPVKVFAEQLTQVPNIPGTWTVPVDTKGQKTPCFEAPGAKGTTVTS